MKFWKLDERIRKDKRKPGVQMDLDKSEVPWDLARLIKDKVITMMILIGFVQAVGTVLTAISAVVFKTISSLMIVGTLLLLCFGLFSWVKTEVVVLIAVSMF